MQVRFMITQFNGGLLFLEIIAAVNNLKSLSTFKQCLIWYMYQTVIPSMRFFPITRMCKTSSGIISECVDNDFETTVNAHLSVNCSNI